MDFGLIVVYLIISIISTVWWYVWNKYRYWQKRGVPHLEPLVIPYGNLKNVARKIHLKDFTREIYEKYKGTGPFIGLYFFCEPVALILDLDLIKNILIKDFSNFQDRKRYYNERDEPLSAHIGHIEGEKWRLVRHKLSPTFTSLRMKQVFPLIAELAQRLIETIDPMVGDGNVVEIQNLLGRYSTDIIGTVIYGLECNSLKDPSTKFRVMTDKATNTPRHREYVRLFMECYPDLARKFRLKLLPDDVSSFFTEVINDTISYRERNNVRRNDFMDLLIQLKNFGTLEGHKGEIGKLSSQEIAAQAYAFFSVGIETSSSTLGLALYMLSLHPEIQEKARKVINDTIEKHHGEFTYEAMMEMKYLHQITDETLRFYSPAPTLLRQCVQTYRVPGTNFIFEKGTEIIIPIYGIHFDPEIYPNPKVFNPDNFSQEAIAKRPPCTYFGFGEGPRNCIGMRLGKQSMFTGLVHLLRKYRFKPSSRTPIPLEFRADLHNMRTTTEFFLHIEKL